MRETMDSNQPKGRKFQSFSRVIFSGLVLGLLAFPVFGQTSTYVIESVGSYDQTFFETAIGNAKWDSYRKPMSRVTLQFDRGASIVLLSGNELNLSGVTFNGGIMLPENAQLNPARQFSIHSSGIVLEAAPAKIEK